MDVVPQVDVPVQVLDKSGFSLALSFLVNGIFLLGCMGTITMTHIVYWFQHGTVLS